MIKKTMLKNTIVIILVIATILVAIGGGILIASDREQKDENNRILDRIIADTLKANNPYEPPFKMEMRSFVVVNGNIKNYDTNYFTEAEILVLIDKAIQIGDSGFIGYVFCKSVTINENTVIAGIDRTIERTIFNDMVKNILIFGVSGIVLLFIIFLFLSKWILNPVEKTIKMQREFVSDASHEFKTPITAIKANIDVLEDELPNNKWVTNIKHENERLASLTKELLYLATIDEGLKIEKSEENLSNLIKDELIFFIPLFEDKNKPLVIDIQDNIIEKIDVASYKNAISIIIYNALVHGTENSVVKVYLHKGIKTILGVYNENEYILNTEKEKLFRRFYRSDKSRSRKTGGNGLGLSILRKLAENNGWKIELKIIDNTSFCIELLL